MFGETHPSVASSLNNLGNAYGALGNHEKQFECLSEALKIRRALFDITIYMHPGSIIAKSACLSWYNKNK